VTDSYDRRFKRFSSGDPRWEALWNETGVLPEVRESLAFPIKFRRESPQIIIPTFSDKIGVDNIPFFGELNDQPADIASFTEEFPPRFLTADTVDEGVESDVHGMKFIEKTVGLTDPNTVGLNSPLEFHKRTVGSRCILRFRRPQNKKEQEDVPVILHHFKYRFFLWINDLLTPRTDRPRPDRPARLSSGLKSHPERYPCPEFLPSV